MRGAFHYQIFHHQSDFTTKNVHHQTYFTTEICHHQIFHHRIFHYWIYFTTEFFTAELISPPNFKFHHQYLFIKLPYFLVLVVWYCYLYWFSKLSSLIFAVFSVFSFFLIFYKQIFLRSFLSFWDFCWFLKKFSIIFEDFEFFGILLSSVPALTRDIIIHTNFAYKNSKNYQKL